MADGHLNKCKACCIIDSKIYSQTPEGKVTERRRNQKPKRKQEQQTNIQKWRKDHPEKYRAQTAVSNAVRDGRLSKPDSCQECTATENIHGHHEDYSEPLDVIWLCPTHHKLRHRILQTINVI